MVRRNLEILFIGCVAAVTFLLGVYPGLYSDMFRTVFDAGAALRHTTAPMIAIPWWVFAVSATLLVLGALATVFLCLVRLGRAEKITSWEWALLLISMLLFLPMIQVCYLLTFEGQGFYADRAWLVFLGYYGVAGVLVLIALIFQEYSDEEQRQLQELTGTVPVEFALDEGETELFRVFATGWRWCRGTLLLTNRQLRFSGTSMMRSKRRAIAIPYDRLIHLKRTFVWFTGSRHGMPPPPAFWLTYRDEGGRAATFPCGCLSPSDPYEIATMREICVFLEQASRDATFRRELGDGRRTVVVDPAALERRVETVKREGRYDWIFVLVLPVIVWYPEWYVLLSAIAVATVLSWLLKRHARAGEGE